MVYRLGMLVTVAGSYFILRPLLPALHPVLLDVQLLHIDEHFFGKTPSAWLDAFVTPKSVEWFAFFYYSYYAVLATHAIGTLLFDDGQRRYELLLAAALVASIGHAGYTFVPGAGPYACAQLTFVHSLTGGIWWNRVLTTVTSAGAGLDIFPSLHTGFSSVVALHAFRHRGSAPYRFTFLPTGFVVANIIIATVFLRWHYGVDLIAGGLLAFGAQQVAIRAWRSEGLRGVEDDRQAVWEAVLPTDMAISDRRFITGVILIHATVVVALVCALCDAPDQRGTPSRGVKLHGIASMTARRR
jgi:membrane-associated phospholipid phosphatase